MIKLKTADLTGAALRYAVAVACGWKLQRIEDGNWKEGEPHWWEAINEKAVVPGKRNGLVGYIKPGARGVTSGYDYCPDVDWSRGGPLIDKMLKSGKWEIVQWEPGVALQNFDSECLPVDCVSYDDKSILQSGETVLIAACRAIVADRLGDEVEVPAELVKP